MEDSEKDPFVRRAKRFNELRSKHPDMKDAEVLNTIDDEMVRRKRGSWHVAKCTHTTAYTWLSTLCWQPRRHTQPRLANSDVTAWLPCSEHACKASAQGTL